MKENLFYKIDNGVWSTEAVKFVDIWPETDEEGYRELNPPTLENLIETLTSYDYPLGELESEKNKYLTARKNAYQKHTGPYGPVTLTANAVANALTRGEAQDVINKRKEEHAQALMAMKLELQAITLEFDAYTAITLTGTPPVCGYCGVQMSENYNDKFRGDVWVCGVCGNAVIAETTNKGVKK